MPRKPRYYLPGIPAHIVQRGNCRQAVFFSDEDYSRYLEWLGEGAIKHGCQIHAYVLMTNHVHLLMTPQSHESISKIIQYIGRNYVTYVNRCYGRSGTLWEGRHKGCLISDDDYLLACMRYIELNPVRAGMVEHPSEYPWSSYRYNALGKQDVIVTPHDLYRGLGRNPKERQNAYSDLFDAQIDDKNINTNATFVLMFS